MPDPNEAPSALEDEKLQDLLSEADRLAAEVEAEVEAEMAISASGPTAPTEITPEMLENLDPAQLQALMQMLNAGQKQRKPQSFYTRKQTPKAVKKQKRKAQRHARKVTIRNGGGKTTPLRTRGASRGG